MPPHNLLGLALAVLPLACATRPDHRAHTRGDLAWTFTTQTTGPSLAALRALPTTWSLPTGVTGGPAALTTLDIVGPLSQASMFTGVDWHSQIRWAKEGVFTSGTALTADDHAVLVEYIRHAPDGPPAPVAEVFEIAGGKITASRVYHG